MAVKDRNIKNERVNKGSGRMQPRTVTPIGRAARARATDGDERNIAKRNPAPVKKSSGSRSASASGSSSENGRKSAPEKKERQYVATREITYEEGLISNELKIIFTGLVSVLLILSYLNLCGKVGGYINYLVFGVFGYFGFAFPFVLFALVFFALRNPGKDVTLFRFLMGTGFVLNVSSLVQMAAGGYNHDIKWLRYFTNSVPSYVGDDKTYGGLAGGILCKLLCPNFGNVAAVFIMVVFALVFLILIMGKAILTRMGKSGIGLVKKSRERERRIKEEMARRRLEEEEAEEDETLSVPERKKPAKKTKVQPVEEEFSEDTVPVNKSGKRRMRQREVNPVVYEEPQEAVLSTGRKEGFIDNLMRRGMGMDAEGEEASNERPSSAKAAYDETDQVEEIRRGIEEYAREISEGSEDAEESEQPESYADSELKRKFGNRETSSLAAASREFRKKEERLTRITMEDDELAQEYEQKGSEAIAVFADNVRDINDAAGRGDRAEAAESKIIDFGTGEIIGENVQENQPSSTEDACEIIPEVSDEEETAEADEKDNSAVGRRNSVKDISVFREGKGVRGSSGAVSFTDNSLPPTGPEKPAPPAYEFPPIELLKATNSNSKSDEASNAEAIKLRLRDTFESFGVKAEITDYSCGPTVTRFEVKPELGVKVKTITALKDDIKLALAAEEIRIEAPIPGKDAVGIEVPNKEKSPVMFRDMISTDLFKNHKSPLALAIGKDIGGKTQIGDIEKMLHILIAGSTGSGKSVFINTLIMSILFHAKPTDVKLIMVDPKRVELTGYNGIPHLLIPVITDPKKALGALNWAIAEMTERYTKFEDAGVKKIVDYNELKQKNFEAEGNTGDCPEKLPRIVFIIDELNDLMMTAASKEVEDAIVRLTQLARAAGIYLVIATQRPSVNVITGTIKANIPTRIAFSVSSAIDSRTILDSAGAEALLGNGDMLFAPNGSVKPVRLQGSYISDVEIESVVDFLKDRNRNHKYNEAVAANIENNAAAIDKKNAAAEAAPAKPADGRDELFHDAGRMIIEKQKASIGTLQRVFSIGFNRAARIMDQLADAGVVGPEMGTKPRDILMNLIQFEQLCGGSADDAAEDMAEAEADAEDIAENAVKSE